jgi:hypothetical protein
MSGQVDFKKAAGVVSQVAICIIAAVSSGFVLAHVWTASLGLGLVLAVLLYGAGLFQFVHRKAPLGHPEE